MSADTHKQVKRVANAAQQIADTWSGIKTLIQNDVWPEVKVKLGKLSDAATKSLPGFDDFVKRVVVVLELNSKLVNEEVWPEVKNRLGQFSKLSNALELLTKIFALALMLLATLLCRLAISSIQAEEYSLCSSLQKSTLYAFYISCILLAFYFTFSILFDVGILDRQEEYRVLWLFLAVIPLLETVFCIMRYLIQGFFSLLWTTVSRFSERLTFAVLCAATALGVAVYVGMMGSEDMEVSE